MTVTTYETLRAEAERSHAQWPQYRNHWDGWRVVEVTKRQTGKGRRVQFEAGDVALAEPDTRRERVAPRGTPVPYEEWPVVEFVTVHSWRTGIDTSVRAANVQEVAT